MPFAHPSPTPTELFCLFAGALNIFRKLAFILPQCCIFSPLTFNFLAFFICHVEYSILHVLEFFLSSPSLIFMIQKLKFDPYQRHLLNNPFFLH